MMVGDAWDWEEALDSLRCSVEDGIADRWELDVVRRRVQLALAAEYERGFNDGRNDMWTPGGDDV
jgi:hypothetical protein